MADSGFELSGWAEFKEGLRRDIARIESSQTVLDHSIQEVRELITRKIDAFRAEEIERLRSEQRLEAERARKTESDLTDRLAEIRTRTTSELAALKVRASVWGGISGAIPAILAAMLWYLTHK
jgi:hypothetical protein